MAARVLCWRRSDLGFDDILERKELSAGRRLQLSQLDCNFEVSALLQHLSANGRLLSFRLGTRNHNSVPYRLRSGVQDIATHPADCVDAVDNSVLHQLSGAQLFVAVHARTRWDR